MIALERFPVAAPANPPEAGAEIRPMSILAVGPHPDDIEIGCGAALRRYARFGHRVTMLVMTSGEVGGDRAVRRAEVLASAAVLGVAEVVIAPFEDTKIPLTKEVIAAVESIVRETGADMVLVNHPADTHQDHRTTAECVLSATRYVRNVLYYEVPSTVDFAPDIFIEAGEEMEAKRRALLAHASQVHKVNIADLSILDVAEANAIFRGIQGRVKRAEAFKALRLHINVRP